MYDAFFLKEILVPYLSNVYFNLIHRQMKKNYLSINKTLQYLNLPLILTERFVDIINANSDQRIDHDEFVQFFIRLLMGSLD